MKELPDLVGYTLLGAAVKLNVCTKLFVSITTPIRTREYIIDCRVRSYKERDIDIHLITKRNRYEVVSVKGQLILRIDAPCPGLLERILQYVRTKWN